MSLAVLKSRALAGMDAPEVTFASACPKPK